MHIQRAKRITRTNHGWDMEYVFDREQTEVQPSFVERIKQQANNLGWIVGEIVTEDELRLYIRPPMPWETKEYQMTRRNLDPHPVKRIISYVAVSPLPYPPEPHWPLIPHEHFRSVAILAMGHNWLWRERFISRKFYDWNIKDDKEAYDVYMYLTRFPVLTTDHRHGHTLPR